MGLLPVLMLGITPSLFIFLRWLERPKVQYALCARFLSPYKDTIDIEERSPRGVYFQAPEMSIFQGINVFGRPHQFEYTVSS